MTTRQRVSGLFIGTLYGAVLGGWGGLMVGSVYLLAPGCLLGILAGALVGVIALPRVAVGTLIGYLACGVVTFFLLARTGMRRGEADYIGSPIGQGRMVSLHIAPIMTAESAGGPVTRIVLLVR